MVVAVTGVAEEVVDMTEVTGVAVEAEVTMVEATGGIITEDVVGGGVDVGISHATDMYLNIVTNGLTHLNAELIGIKTDHANCMAGDTRLMSVPSF